MLNNIDSQKDTFAYTLQPYLQLTLDKIQQFAKSSTFSAHMSKVFGKIDINLQKSWSEGRFDLPEIVVTSQQIINGAYGAFAGATNTIYLAKEFLEKNALNTDAIVRLLLQEYGHSIDYSINSFDSPGDEGEIFAALVLNESLDEPKLLQLQTKDDTATIFLNNQILEIEQGGAVPGGGGDDEPEEIIGDSDDNNLSANIPAGKPLFMLGFAGDDTLTGGFSNDSLVGGDDDDILSGVLDETVSNKEQAGKDGMLGGQGADLFILGVNDWDTPFYDDGDTTQAGTLHYATIDDLNKDEDKIQLKGLPADYILDTSPTPKKLGTGIFYKRNPGQVNELIAVITNFTPDNLNLEEKYFVYTNPKEEPPPSNTISFKESNFRVRENDDSTESIILVRSSDSNKADVRLKLTDGTATSDDYDGNSIDISFAPGEVEKTVRVPINNDSDKEDDETINLSLESLSEEFVIGSQNEATLTIQDDESLHTVYEFIAKDTAYKKDYYQAGDEIDGYDYKVDKVFNDENTGFFALGLTSTKEESPLLAIRGTEPVDGYMRDIFSDIHPEGIGFNQFTSNVETVTEWLNNQENPGITGHSLGGALSQYFASDFTSKGGRLNEIVTFNSPGISTEYTDIFNSDNAETVNHYITSGDIASLAGEEFIDGNYTIASFSDINLLNKHLLPFLSEAVGYDQEEKGSERPNDVTYKTFTSVDFLNSDFFTYTDKDYWAWIFGGVAATQFFEPLKPFKTIPPLLTSRKTVESSRKAIGSGIKEISDKITRELEVNNNFITDLANFIDGISNFHTNSKLNFEIIGAAEITFPDFKISGFNLGRFGKLRGGFLISFTNDGDYSNDYIQASARLGRFSPNAVIKVFFDGRVEPSINFGNNLVETSSFTIDSQPEWIMLNASWDNPSNNAAVYITKPDGTRVDESEFAANNIEIIENLISDTNKAVIVKNPEAGIWDINLVDTTGLGSFEYSGFIDSKAPEIDITSLVPNETGSEITINYIAQDPDSNAYNPSSTNFDPSSEAKISFFYDNDNEGNDGILIETGIPENDGNASYTWNTQGIAPGDYYVYAMIVDGSNAPVFNYFQETVKITEYADLVVTKSASSEPVKVGDSFKYIIQVTNDGSVESQGVKLSETLPPEINLVSTTPNFVSQSQNQLDFDLGNIAAGATETVEITVSAPLSPQLLRSRTQVESQTVDPDKDNNVDITYTDVVTELPQTTSEASFSDNQIFDFGGNFGETKQLKFSLASQNSKSPSEIGVFAVDDAQGNINGIAPSDSAYLTTALENSRTIFSLLPNNIFEGVDFTRQLNFDASQRLGFYLIQDSTADTVLADLKNGVEPGIVSFAISTANESNFAPLQISQLEDESFQLAWRDAPNDNKENFLNLVLNMEVSEETSTSPGTGLQDNTELIDLRNTTSVQATFSVASEAKYDNVVGWYRIDDENGSIGELKPGDAGYAQKAIGERSVVHFNHNGTQQPLQTLQMEGLLAPYIIVDSTRELFLQNNPNLFRKQERAYFAFMEANPDKADHIRLLGDNTFGFEDLFNGGDKDYNDMILKVDLV